VSDSEHTFNLNHWCVVVTNNKWEFMDNWLCRNWKQQKDQIKRKSDGFSDNNNRNTINVSKGKRTTTKNNNSKNYKTLMNSMAVTNLNSTMIFVVIEAEWAKSTIHTIQTIHIALTLVWISMQLALNKETLFEQRFQPWWPPVFLIIRSSSTLQKIYQILNQTHNSKSQIKSKSLHSQFFLSKFNTTFQS